ncbi:hypothetical protein [Lichenibacterium dinghuense]|uniref:hypothetical protein n=1 Tax=Lichenibacterium dinghuense TaxID=2895977 RepID=UPI001F2BF4D5|nr:hypothetical protein [Lichenibacterium sp. 6Y81]
MSPHHPFLRTQDSSDGAARGERSVGQDLDNIFRLTAAQPAPQPQPAPERVRAPGAEPRRVTPPDLDAALDMLNRASKAMDLMQSRYQQVEDYAKGVADRAEKDIAVAYAQAREWEVRAAGSENKLEELRQRAEAAERRAEAAERNAKEARDWLECFYDKIVTSFDTRNFLKSQAA